MNNKLITKSSGNSFNSSIKSFLSIIASEVTFNVLHEKNLYFPVKNSDSPITYPFSKVLIYI